MTLTIEELKYGAEVGDLGIEAVRAVCAEALANREAQPVVDPYMYELWKFDETVPELERWFLVERSHSKLVASKGQKVVLLYTAPPASAVPDEITAANAPEVFEIAAEVERLGLRGTYGAYAAGWNACRTAMLEATSRN